MSRADIRDLLIKCNNELDKLERACQHEDEMDENDDIEDWICAVTDASRSVEYRNECRRKLQAIGFDTSLFE